MGSSGPMRAHMADAERERERGEVFDLRESLNRALEDQDRLKTSLESEHRALVDREKDLVRLTSRLERARGLLKELTRDFIAESVEMFDRQKAADMPMAERCEEIRAHGKELQDAEDRAKAFLSDVEAKGEKRPDDPEGSPR